MEIVIVSLLVALVDDQVKEVAKLGLCAAQLGVHNERKSWRGKQKMCPLFWVSLICMSLLHYATVPEYLSQN